MAKVEIIKSKCDNQNNTSDNFKRKKVCAYARVSTDSDEQLTSYESQINYYSEKIKANPKWKFVGVYADEGITGTQIKNRIQFQNMIDDAVAGKIDMIIAKSISRFARNTLDTLRVVRLLRDKNVDVFFEKENIHTLELDSELFLTLYSAFAQSESESTSLNVKMGLKAKMKRGEYCGQANPFGYNWNKETKKLEINEHEAPVVELIFELYKNGMGSKNIAKRLNEIGLKPRVVDKWDSKKICRILKNPKYVGDLLSGKYYVVDPISHKKRENFGEREQYYVRDAHEPIISRDTWDKVQEIYKKRSYKITNTPRGHGSKFSMKYPLSSKIECACCGANYMRRVGGKTGKGNETKRVVYWRCATKVNKIKTCEADNSIREIYLQELFIYIYNKLIEKKHKTKDQLLGIIKDVLINGDSKDTLIRLNKEKERLEERLSHLIDLKLDDYSNVYIYEAKEKEINKNLNEINEKIKYYSKSEEDNKKLEDRIAKIESILDTSTTITEFDEELFNGLVKKIIIGQYDENGNFNQNVIKFILNIDSEYSFEIKKKEDNSVSNGVGKFSSWTAILRENIFRHF